MLYCFFLLYCWFKDLPWLVFAFFIHFQLSLLLHFFSTDPLHSSTYFSLIGSAFLFSAFDFSDFPNLWFICLTAFDFKNFLNRWLFPMFFSIWKIFQLHYYFLCFRLAHMDDFSDHSKYKIWNTCYLIFLTILNSKFEIHVTRALMLTNYYLCMFM